MDSKKGIVDIGRKRELMLDDFLQEKTTGDLRIVRHEPVPQPPEPSQIRGYYQTILKTEDGRFRITYRGVVDGYDGPGHDGNPGEFTGIAESEDGIHWQKPVLNLFPDAPSNAIWSGTVETHNFVPFIDGRPGCPKKERYKAVAGLCTGGGLFRFHSEDGVHWEKYPLPPIMGSLPPSRKTLDSQNVCFWSESESRYVLYFRASIVTEQGELRSLARATSRDFIEWDTPIFLDVNRPGENLYVSLLSPYFRAPHIIIGTPTRFFENRGCATDIALIHTRDGVHIQRPFPDAWIRPGRNRIAWENRSNYLCNNIVQTGKDELSLYHTRMGIRYTLRLDGFASLHAGAEGGTWISRPLRFGGGSLECNVETSAGGAFQVGLLAEDGTPLKGFSCEECDLFFGDEIGHRPSWNGRTELPLKSGESFRLCFKMKECDLYSFCFSEMYQEETISWICARD